MESTNESTNALVRWFGLERALKIISSDSELKRAERELCSSIGEIEIYCPESITAHSNALRVVRALIAY